MAGAEYEYERPRREQEDDENSQRAAMEEILRLMEIELQQVKRERAKLMIGESACARRLVSEGLVANP